MISLQKKALIFFHIPKCGGTTLRDILARNFNNNTIYVTDSCQVEGSLADNSFNFYQRHDMFKFFKNVPIEKRKEIKLLLGHMSFGLHQFLPQKSTYITMIRNPVTRVVSNYHHISRDKRCQFHDEVKNGRLSLEMMVRSNMIKNNFQTYLIAGKDNFASAHDFSERNSKNVLEVAKQNIEKYFSLVGMVEKFDDFLLASKKLFGFRNIFYAKKNVTDNQKSLNIPKFLQIKIEEKNVLDLELYEWINNRFNQITKNILRNNEKVVFSGLNKQFGKIYRYSPSPIKATTKNIIKKIFFSNLKRDY